MQFQIYFRRDKILKLAYTMPFIILFLILAVANLCEKIEMRIYVSSYVPEIRWDKNKKVGHMTVTTLLWVIHCPLYSTC